MKSVFIFISFSLLSCQMPVRKENTSRDGEKLSVKYTDSSWVSSQSYLCNYYLNTKPDSCSYYAKKIIGFSQKANYPYGEALGFYFWAAALDRTGNYPKSLEMAYSGMKMADQLKPGSDIMRSRGYFQIALLNILMNKNAKGIIYCHKGLELVKKSGRSNLLISELYSFLSVAYANMGNLDSGLYYAQKGYYFYLQSSNDGSTQPFLLLPIAPLRLGWIYARLGKYTLARKFDNISILTGKKYHLKFLQVMSLEVIASLFSKEGQMDSAVYFAKEALNLTDLLEFPGPIKEASNILIRSYESTHQPDSTLKYMKIMLAANDTLFSQEKVQEFQLANFDEEQQKQAIEVARTHYVNQIRTYVLIIASVVFLLLAGIFYLNIRQKKAANILLNAQNSEIQQALADLRTTQAQLIQSEKMASLGELTAGIAHEIQNPLNFINNFSEVNTELINELVGEIDKGNSKEVKSIAEDILINEQKINHHGRRADAIVKGMLQHSRTSTGQKELTDINALVEEYFKLSYQGLRAKDKSFHADTQTDFDPSLGKIYLVAQDFGRVLLNLFNNAFYAVMDKKKALDGNYEPVVSVYTKKLDGKIEIRIKDNGLGISRNVIDKIFQPFFSTKPTGLGTGLGLSISYDIIKAQGGDIKVQTKEGEFAEFVIHLPFNQVPSI